jgi:hypothetical protein
MPNDNQPASVALPLSANTVLQDLPASQVVRTSGGRRLISEVEESSMADHKESDADQAMRALTQLFSTPEVKAKAHLRCSINGPTEFDVLFESVLDDLFGRDPNSDYKCWIRRLYKDGLISNMPDDWKGKDPEAPTSDSGRQAPPNSPAAVLIRPASVIVR